MCTRLSGIRHLEIRMPLDMTRDQCYAPVGLFKLLDSWQRAMFANLKLTHFAISNIEYNLLLNMSMLIRQLKISCMHLQGLMGQADEHHTEPRRGSLYKPQPILATMSDFDYVTANLSDVVRLPKFKMAATKPEAEITFER